MAENRALRSSAGSRGSDKSAARRLRNWDPEGPSYSDGKTPFVRMLAIGTGTLLWARQDYIAQGQFGSFFDWGFAQFHFVNSLTRHAECVCQRLLRYAQRLSNVAELIRLHQLNPYTIITYPRPGVLGRGGGLLGLDCEREGYFPNPKPD